MVSCAIPSRSNLSNVEHAKFKQDSEGGHSLLDEARDSLGIYFGLNEVEIRLKIMEEVEVWVSLLV